MLNDDFLCFTQLSIKNQQCCLFIGRASFLTILFPMAQCRHRLGEQYSFLSCSRACETKALVLLIPEVSHRVSIEFRSGGRLSRIATAFVQKSSFPRALPYAKRKGTTVLMTIVRMAVCPNDLFRTGDSLLNT